MEINVKQNNGMQFSELTVGDVFTWNNLPYVKIANTYTENAVKMGDEYNIVRNFSFQARVFKATKLTVEVD